MGWFTFKNWFFYSNFECSLRGRLRREVFKCGFLLTCCADLDDQLSFIIGEHSNRHAETEGYVWEDL